MNLSILIYVFKALKSNQVSDIYIACVISIWIAYLIQSMLSPDQVLLASIGYSAAGFIIGNYLKTKKSVVEGLAIRVRNKYLVRIMILTVLLLTLVTYVRAFEANYGAKKMLEGRFTSSSQYLAVLNSFPNTKVAELIAVELVKDYSNCGLAEQVAARMIEIDPRNSQGWFIKAVCSNASKNFSLAIDYVNQSLLFDPYNPFYLISKAKLEAINGQLTDAKNTLLLAKKINPPGVCGDNVLANTEPCANLREIISLEVSIRKLEDKS
jgi:tetratricopeptide (TPR) repeat protein